MIYAVFKFGNALQIGRALLAKVRLQGRAFDQKGGAR